MTPFRFWEQSFFVTVFGAVALYPFAVRFASLPFSNAPLAILLTITTVLAFVALVFFEKFHETKRGSYAIAGAFAVALLMPTLGLVASITSTAFAAWFTETALAVLIFGCLAARNLNERIELDFMKHAGNAIATGLGANIFILLMIQLTSIVPPVFVVLSAVALTLTFALPS